MTLDVVALKGVVIFPTIQTGFETDDPAVIEVLENAFKTNSEVFVVCMREDENLKGQDALYSVGTVARVDQLLSLPDGGSRIVLDGRCRAMLSRYYPKTANRPARADIMTRELHTDDTYDAKCETLIRHVRDIIAEFAKYVPNASPEFTAAAEAIKDPGLLADFIACHVLYDYKHKQLMLEAFDPQTRLEALITRLEQELELASLELDLQKRVQDRLDQNQRDYYLREQLKTIKGELGEGDYDSDDDIEEYYKQIEELRLPEEIAEKLNKEVKKLTKLPFGSAESSVIKAYLDVCLEFPWKKLTKDRIDIEAASKVLEKDHDGLEKVKQRILEFLAVKQLTPELKNQILCLVGPPGTGKTSIVASIARAMKRKYVRVSLGGVRDEADIRGHRKTYIGAMPGRIIEAMTRAGVRNPIILLDEIDKMTRDAHGDPSSALLEVLDSEQNKSFRDHFMELPVDLSECIFIATANTLETVPTPLIDRMEIIELKIYTRHEKLSIAKNHLIPKQLKRHGLTKRMLRIDDDAIYELIDFYTHEAGVRNLEREIANLCRKAAKKIVEEELARVDIKGTDIAKYLGRRKLKPDHIADEDEVGVVNGLAYTELGGDILKIEASAMPGTGKLELTGSLGDVMKESARTAISYIRAHADSLKIDADFYKNRDIHIHVPEGAVPKDGPSAGVSITTALTSELSGRPVRRDIAMTGEISLRGRVIAIGGLKEKTMAAYKAGVQTVLIPADNMDDLEDIDPTVREKLEFIPCTKLDDVLSRAIVTE